MSEKKGSRRILNIKDLISALMALQVAISKLAIELIKKEHLEENLTVLRKGYPYCFAEECVQEETGGDPIDVSRAGRVPGGGRA